MTRHALVENTGLLEAVHRCVARMSGSQFLAVLPALRLAFTLLSPREVRKVSIAVERLLGAEKAVAPAAASDDVRLAASRVDDCVADWLRRWHLG
jgi:hypothetical protein